tara:strand:- start:742 stop:1353 length:612 start_codon:yes stop_codon:yes gene_type:complete
MILNTILQTIHISDLYFSIALIVLIIIWSQYKILRSIITNNIIAIILIAIININFYTSSLPIIRFVSIILYLILLIIILKNDYNSIFQNRLNNKYSKSTILNKNRSNKSILKNSANTSNISNQSKKSVRFSKTNKYFEPVDSKCQNVFKFNIWSFILLLIANLVIIKLPHWPYNMKRIMMLGYYNFIVITIWIIVWIKSLDNK